MSPLLRITALSLCSVAAGVLCVFGAMYSLRREFMPYHGQAVSKTWVELDAPMRHLIRSFLRLAGAGFLTGALAVAVLVAAQLFFPEQAWSLIAAPIVGLSLGLPVQGAAVYLRNHTPARPPVGLAAVANMVLFLALACAVVSVVLE